LESHYSPESVQIETSKIHSVIDVKDGKEVLRSWILSPVVQTALELHRGDSRILAHHLLDGGC
jgi:hypothetical protein